MITISNVSVFGWDAAIRGMRNPMNSWDKSDSYFCKECVNQEVDPHDCPIDNTGDDIEKYYFNGCHIIGENDLKLMKSLSKAGSDHGKFLRMINVSFDLCAPLYFLKEWDTYKVGTVANSCSTMHKIHAKEFTLDDFSHEHLELNFNRELLDNIIHCLNVNREKFLETKDKTYWWQMIQLLPSSYNQLRTVQLNYQVLKNMYHSRKNHKLDEWRDFCKFIESLPYSELITGVEEK